MIFHWASVSVVRIKVASYLATLNHSATDLGILKRQQTLENKKNILARSQKITRGNLTILDAWVTCQQRVSWVKPTAGKTAMLKVDLPMTTHAFCVDLLKPTSAMLTSGDAFDMDENVRNGYANGADVLEAGLDRIGAYLANFCLELPRTKLMSAT